jgi:hypothetical protein
LVDLRLQDPAAAFKIKLGPPLFLCFTEFITNHKARHRQS